jgi:ribonuclease VapC
MDEEMSMAVLDSSALVASIRNERGGDALLDESFEWIMSSVNFAEAVNVLMRGGYTRHEACQSIDTFDIRVVDFDRGLAEASGAMIAQTRALGLSFGDCACLALAAREKLPVLTTDRAWKGLELGVEIRFLR